MPATKLTPELKQQILNLYCETDASTTELASQFDVSSSTVLRLLQGSMSTEDYQKSVKQKQSKNKRSPQSDTQKSPSQKSKKSKTDLFSESSGSLTESLAESLAENLAEDLDFEQSDRDSEISKKTTQKVSKSRNIKSEKIKPSNTGSSNAGSSNTKTVKKPKELKEPKSTKKERNTRELPELNQLDLMAPFLSSSPTGEDRIFSAFAPEVPTVDEQPSQVVPESLPVPVKDSVKALPKKVLKPAIAARTEASSPSPIKTPSQTSSQTPREKFSEEEAIIDEVSSDVVSFVDSKEFADDEFEGLEDEAEDELEEGEESEDIENLEDFGDSQDRGTEIKIHDLENADLPLTCYMVVDKSSEMITRPLRDFREIGKIPPEEESRATLLIFSNHRVAKRFSRQNQRIIKFSGSLIYITHEKLAAKGITRLLFEGRVYAL